MDCFNWIDGLILSFDFRFLQLCLEEWSMLERVVSRGVPVDNESAVHALVNAWLPDADKALLACKKAVLLG